MTRALLLGVLLSALAGCSAGSEWGRARTLDALDVLPMSVGWGGGIGASVQATPAFALGVGLTPTTSRRAGYADRALHGTWREFRAPLPWSLWVESLEFVPPRPAGAPEGPLAEGLPLDYLWQVSRDAPSGEGQLAGGYEPLPRHWGRHPPTGRETSGGLLIPSARHALAWTDLRHEQGDEEPLAVIGSPTTATLWSVSRDGRRLPHAWDLFEVDVFAGILGLRVGFRPIELIDAVAGLILLDPLGDDPAPLRSPTH